MVHGRMQRFHPKACMAACGCFLLFRGAWPHATLPSEIIFSRFEVVRPIYAEKQKIVVRLINENGGSIKLGDSKMRKESKGYLEGSV